MSDIADLMSGVGIKIFLCVVAFIGYWAFFKIKLHNQVTKRRFDKWV